MKQTVQLIAAPVAMQPGGYVAEAYQDRHQATTAQVELSVEKVVARGWRVELQWPCPQPVADIHQQTDLFADAAALMVPVVADAPWISMGERGKPVAAVLWRADRAGLYQLHAEGMGTMQRSEAPAAWSAQSQWSEGHYRLVFNIDAWAPLDQQRQLGIAIWRGSKSERGGLKSVSPGWIAA